MAHPMRKAPSSAELLEAARAAPPPPLDATTPPEEYRRDLESQFLAKVLERGAAAFAELVGTPFGADWLTGATVRRAFEAAAEVVKHGRGLGGIEPRLIGEEVRRLAPGFECHVQEACELALEAWGGETAVGYLRSLVGELADVQTQESDAAEATKKVGLNLAARWVEFTTTDLERDPPRKEFLWEGRIPLGDAGVFAAGGGNGKTSLLVGLAIHRAMGIPFLGRAVRRGSTVIVTTEDGRDDYRRKIAAQRDWMRDQFDAEAVAHHLHVIDLAGEPFRLVRSHFGDYVPTDHPRMLADLVRARDPETDLIIIETVSRVGGDEGNAAMSALIVAAEQLAKLAHATVLLVAHVSQDAERRGVGDAYAPRGGSAITDNGRFTITLAKLLDEQVGDLLPGVTLSPEQLRDLRVLRVPKINCAPAQAPAVLQRVATPWGLALRLYDVPTTRNAEEARRASRRAIGEQLRAMAQRYTDLGEHLTEAKLGGGLFKDVSGLSKQRVPAAVADAIEDGYVHRGPAGRGGGRGCLLPGPVSSNSPNSPAPAKVPGGFAGELPTVNANPPHEPTHPLRHGRAGELNLSPVSVPMPVGARETSRESSPGEFSST